MTETSFINDYYKHIMKKYPTHPDWAILCALTALSTVLGNNTKLYTRLGELVLNLYSLIIGPSRTSYKSTPLKYVLIPTLISAGEQSEPETKFVLPSRWSIEGIIEYMNDGISDGCMIRDEFTGLFKGVLNKKYLAETLELLSEMYDGQIQPRYTKSSKLEEVRDCTVNLISATTPYIYTIMPHTFFIQGTGNRFLFVKAKPDRKKVLAKKKNQFIPRESETMQITPEIRNFAKRLLDIKDNAPNTIYVNTGEANNLLNKLTEKYTNKTFALQKRDCLNLQASYYADVDIYAAKIAALHCISRRENSYNYDLDQGMLQFETRDVKWGITMEERYVKHFEDIMNNWASTAERGRVKTKKADWDFIESIIRGVGGEIMHQDLIAKTSLKPKDFIDIINPMIEGKIIGMRTKKTGKRGPKPTFYYLKEPK